MKYNSFALGVLCSSHYRMLQEIELLGLLNSPSWGEILSNVCIGWHAMDAFA